MTHQLIHIVAGGPKDLLPALNSYRSSDTEIFWLGVDRGVIHLLDAGIIPDLAIGDFDSITEAEWQKIRDSNINFKKFKPEKDETDMELALSTALAMKPNKIRIFGATGGRMDHFLANLFLLLNPIMKDEVSAIEFIDRFNIAEIKKPGTYTLRKLEDKKYVSFIPLTETVKDLTLKGFKYPLEKATIPFGSSRCISNEIIEGSSTFLFTEGILLLVRSTDG